MFIQSDGLQTYFPYLYPCNPIYLNGFKAGVSTSEWLMVREK